MGTLNIAKLLYRFTSYFQYMLPPIYHIKSKDFNRAWVEILQNCMQGKEIIFGDAKNPKKARDTVQDIILEGDAIAQILHNQIHANNPFQLTAQYRNEFSQAFLDDQDAKDPKDRFVYTYYDRFTRYPAENHVFQSHNKQPFNRIVAFFANQPMLHVPSINQLTALRRDLKEQLHTGIASNRSQIITWRPSIDIGHPASPCLQRCRVRYEDDLHVSIHLHWRSRDAWGAWQANLIGIINSIFVEVVQPNDCTIARIYDINDSLHIYDTSIPEVANFLLMENSKLDISDLRELCSNVQTEILSEACPIGPTGKTGTLGPSHYDPMPTR